jgi:hypothetical protein
MARLVHITLEKAASQWVRDVLCAPEIAAVTGFRNCGVTGNFLTGAVKQSLPDGFVGPIYNMNRVEWNALRQADDRALVVLRDPRDRLISLMYSWMYSHGADPFIANVRTLLWSLDSNSARISRLMPEVSYSLRFYLTWLEGAGDDSYITHFEQLVTDPAAGFLAITKWLGCELPREAIVSVTEQFSFEALSKRQKGEVDVTSHHRNGLPGDWRSHFNRANGCEWEELYPGFLVETGYETNSAWWQSLPADRQPADSDATPPDLIEILQRKNMTVGRELEEKEHVIRELAQACNERLAVIHELQSELDRLRSVRKL